MLEEWQIGPIRAFLVTLRKIVAILLLNYTDYWLTEDKWNEVYKKVKTFTSDFDCHVSDLTLVQRDCYWPALFFFTSLYLLYFVSKCFFLNCRTASIHYLKRFYKKVSNKMLIVWSRSTSVCSHE